MAPLFGFLKRNKNKTTDGYASEPQTYTGTWVDRQKKAYRGKFKAQPVFEPDMANGGSWDVRDGTMRPVYAYPTPKVQPQQRPSFDGPSPAEYAAWNSHNAGATLDRFGSVQSKATTFHPPISPDQPSFPLPEIRSHQRARSGSVDSRPEYPSKDKTRRGASQAQMPSQQPFVPLNQPGRPSSRSSYLPPPPPAQTPYAQGSSTPFLQHQGVAQPFAQAQPPPRVPSDTLSEKVRRRTFSGPTPPSKAPPPGGDDPLKRMKNDLQVTSFLLNKLRGIHSDSSAQRYNQQAAASQRPSHRRAASSMGFTSIHNPPVYDYRPEVNPMNLVDPYIDRRRHGTEFHQMMNHGLLTNPIARQAQESSRTRTRSDAAVHAPPSTYATAGSSSRDYQPQAPSQSVAPRRSRHASDVQHPPPSSQHPPIHVRHTSSAPTASSSKPERRQEEYPVFGNFRNPSQFPATAHLSVPSGSRQVSREQERESRRDRDRSRRREEERRERERDQERSRDREQRDHERSRDRDREQRDRERSRDRDREQRDRERSRDREQRDRERVKEKDRERSATLRKKRRESAPATTLAPRSEKIYPIESDDSGYHSSTRPRERRPSSSSAAAATPKKHAPSGLPLDDTPGLGITPEAVAQGLSMTRSEKLDSRRVRFRGGADSVITTPANQANFKGVPARPAIGRAR